MLWRFVRVRVRVSPYGALFVHEKLVLLRGLPVEKEAGHFSVVGIRTTRHSLLPFFIVFFYLPPPSDDSSVGLVVV